MATKNQCALFRSKTAQYLDPTQRSTRPIIAICATAVNRSQNVCHSNQQSIVRKIQLEETAPIPINLPQPNSDVRHCTANPGKCADNEKGDEQNKTDRCSRAPQTAVRGVCSSRGMGRRYDVTDCLRLTVSCDRPRVTTGVAVRYCRQLCSTKKI